MTRMPTPADAANRAADPLLRLEDCELSPLPVAAPARTRPARGAAASGAAPSYPLDDARALALPNPQTPAEEDDLVRRFLAGLETSTLAMALSPEKDCRCRSSA